MFNPRLHRENKYLSDYQQHQKPTSFASNHNFIINETKLAHVLEKLHKFHKCKTIFSENMLKRHQKKFHLTASPHRWAFKNTSKWKKICFPFYICAKKYTERSKRKDTKLQAALRAPSVSLASHFICKMCNSWKQKRETNEYIC